MVAGRYMRHALHQLAARVFRIYYPSIRTESLQYPERWERGEIDGKAKGKEILRTRKEDAGRP
jgi:hypothetical protein